jgi:hypothetical protein
MTKFLRNIFAFILTFIRLLVVATMPALATTITAAGPDESAQPAIVPSASYDVKAQLVNTRSAKDPQSSERDLPSHSTLPAANGVHGLISSIPEPGSVLLIACGLPLLWVFRKRLSLRPSASR